MRLMKRFSKSISMVITLSIILLVIPIEGLTQQTKEKKKNRVRQTPTQYLQKLAAGKAPKNPFIAVTMHAIERYLENTPAQSDIDRAVRKVLDKRGARAKPALQRAVTNWKAVPRSVRESVTPPEFLDLTAAQPVSADQVQKFVKHRYGRVPKHTFKMAETPEIRDPPRVTTLQPAAQYPGGLIRVLGTSFSQGISVKLQSTVWDVQGQMPTTFISDTALEFNISQDLTPGEYLLSLLKNGQEISPPRPFTIRAPRYRVRFMKMHSVDESDPECDCDEVVSAWAVSADDKAWSKITGEYEEANNGEGIGDGADIDYRPGDQVVYPISGEDRPVIDYFALGMRLYEWDSGDAQATEDVLDVTGDLAQELASLFGATGAVIGTIINLILDLIGALVTMFGGDPDGLGYKSIEWTASELQRKTATPNGVYRDRLYFTNNDDKGSYYVEYAIRRIQPQ